MTEKQEIDGATHRTIAIEANNSTWELLDGRELSAVEVDDLLERAYAAAYHWRRADDATTINLARAAWLISRAQSVAGHGDAALHHALRCAELTAEAGAGAADFDLVYALEARARALACQGDRESARTAREEARAVEIAEHEDRQLVEGDLDAEPWFGLDR